MSYDGKSVDYGSAEDLLARIRTIERPSPGRAYDEIVGSALKRQHEPQQIIGDLLDAEINDKHARSIKYQMTIGRLFSTSDLPDNV